MRELRSEPIGNRRVALVEAGAEQYRATIALREQKKPPTVVVSGKPANVGGWC